MHCINSTSHYGPKEWPQATQKTRTAVDIINMVVEVAPLLLVTVAVAVARWTHARQVHVKPIGRAATRTRTRSATAAAAAAGKQRRRRRRQLLVLVMATAVRVHATFGDTVVGHDRLLLLPMLM